MQIAAVEFKKIVFNEFLKKKHPNGYLAKDAVVIQIIATGPISRYKRSLDEEDSQKPSEGDNVLKALPACIVTLLIPEANCLVDLKTAFYGGILEGTSSGHANELYDCTLAGMKGVWKFAVGSKCPVIVIPGEHKK